MNIFTKYVLLTFFLFLSTTLAFCQSGYKVNASSGANIRKGPATTEPVLTKIPDGATVKVLDRSNRDWYKVEYDGKTGYVASSLIKEDTAKENKNENASQNQAKPNESKNNEPAQQNNNRESSSHHTNNKQKKAKSNKNSGNNSNYTWGIGLRLGEPTGITVKKYNSNASAWEVNLGRSSRWGYHYGDDDFYKHSKYDDRNYYHYAGYAPGFTTALQIHYLLQKPINGVEGLNFYYGGGAQLRFTPITYRYYYNEGGWDNDNWWKDNYYYRQDRVTDIDLGLDGVIGLEYHFKNTPISMFVDANLFIEIVDAPFFFSGQGGIGGRYNF